MSTGVDGYARVAEAVREMAGIALDGWPASRLHDTVRRATAACGLRSPEELAVRLAEDPAAREALLAEVTIGETYFLREPKQLEFVARHAVPATRAVRGPGAPVRLWSAACATGEEAYSLAIVLRQRGAGGATDILGTDLCPARIAAARRGAYRGWSLRTLSEEQVREFFRKEGQEHVLRPALRERVRFRVHNLLDPPPERGWDVILCRNALMYLHGDALRRAAKLLLDALAPHGYLLVGASDPLLHEHVRCRMERTEAGLAYRRPGERLARPAPPRPVPHDTMVAEPRRAPPIASAAETADPCGRSAELLRGRQYDAAEALARECVAGEPEREEGWAVLVRALASRGQSSEALDACVAGRERCPESSELLYLHALLLTAQGEPARAVALARQAVFLNPGMAVAQLLLGTVRLQLGERRGAARALLSAERLLAALPADAEVPAADGESAARLLATVRAQLQLIRDPR